MTEGQTNSIVCDSMSFMRTLKAASWQRNIAEIPVPKRSLHDHKSDTDPDPPAKRIRCSYPSRSIHEDVYGVMASHLGVKKPDVIPYEDEANWQLSGTINVSSIHQALALLGNAQRSVDWSITTSKDKHVTCKTHVMEATPSSPASTTLDVSNAAAEVETALDNVINTISCSPADQHRCAYALVQCCHLAEFSDVSLDPLGETTVKLMPDTGPHNICSITIANTHELTKRALAVVFGLVDGVSASLNTTNMSLTVYVHKLESQ